jgi:Ca2+-binding RTX toxin-like protein
LLGLDTHVVSAGGSRIVFRTLGRLTADDIDDGFDLYERAAGQTRLLTPGTADADSIFAGSSRDGSRIFFQTFEALVPTDTNVAEDVYEITGSGLSLVTTGQTDGFVDVRAVSDNGGRVFWETQARALPDDTDDASDIYAAAIAAPRNTALPSVTGSPAAGQTLTCNPGTWQDAESFAYRWNRDGSPIPGGSSPTYVVPPGDAGHLLTCTVTATGDGGSTSATSLAVRVASPAPTGPLPGPCANAAVGTAGADLLLGTAFGDILYGLAGPDRLRGVAGNDCLVGGPGRDRLAGGPGLDKVAGGKAGDRLSGGPGRDRLRGGAGEDRLNGGGAGDRLVAGAGDDRLRARDGNADVVRCSAGHDVAVVDKRDRVSGCEVVRLD